MIITNKKRAAMRTWQEFFCNTIPNQIEVKRNGMARIYGCGTFYHQKNPLVETPLNLFTNSNRVKIVRLDLNLTKLPGLTTSEYLAYSVEVKGVKLSQITGDEGNVVINQNHRRRLMAEQELLAILQEAVSTIFTQAFVKCEHCNGHGQTPTGDEFCPSPLSDCKKCGGSGSDVRYFVTV